MLKAWLLSIAALISLAACSNGEPLAACKGPVFQLNSGYWTLAPVTAGAMSP